MELLGQAHGILEQKMQRKAKIALLAAVGFTLVFMVAEIVGGYLANSLAIMTDAAHLLTDVCAMLVSLFAMHLAERPASSKATFGHGRAEIMGALISVLTIWALVGIIVFEAILRLIDDAKEEGEAVDGMIMTIIGICGLVVNIIDAGILTWGNAPHGHDHGGSDHDHSHGGHGHGDHENINVRGALLHVIGDCLQSLGVILASVVVWVGNYLTTGSARGVTYYNLADPIVSLLFAAITLFITKGLIMRIINILMERVPPGVDYYGILKELEELEGVSEVHDLHIWAVTVGKNCLSCHITADNDHLKTLRAAEKVCLAHNITHTTIQVDPHRSDQCRSHSVHKKTEL